MSTATSIQSTGATSTASCCRSSSGVCGKATLLRQTGAGNDVCTLQRCMYTVATGDDSATCACDATCVGQRATVHTRRTTTRSMQQTTHAQPKPCCIGAQPCCIGAQPCCIGARRRCCGGSDSCDAAVNADSWFAKDKNGTPFAFCRYSIVLIINQSYVKLSLLIGPYSSVFVP